MPHAEEHARHIPARAAQRRRGEWYGLGRRALAGQAHPPSPAHETQAHQSHRYHREGRLTATQPYYHSRTHTLPQPHTPTNIPHAGPPAVPGASPASAVHVRIPTPPTVPPTNTARRPRTHRCPKNPPLQRTQASKRGRLPEPPRIERRLHTHMRVATAPRVAHQRLELLASGV